MPVTMKAVFAFACDSCPETRDVYLETSRLLQKTVAKEPAELAQDLLPEGWEVRPGPEYLCPDCSQYHLLHVSNMTFDTEGETC